MKKGIFIVLYGINNTGKSTQAKMLVERLNDSGHQAEYIKYPIYDLEPSGSFINEYLRKGNPHNLSPREAQIMYTLNRSQFESTLKEKLNNEITIVAEDYTGTGICWGIGSGVEESFMKKINEHLLKEDISFLFKGNRFLHAMEQNHEHETDNELMKRVAKVHEKIGQELNWIEINANDTIKNINNFLMSKISPLLSK